MRIGTRGSKLAMAQAEKVCALLEAMDEKAEPVIVKTSGDVQADRPLYALKGYGAFVREIDDLLLRGDIDAAVHSLKDIPTERPQGLTLAAVLPRESALDVAITRDGRLLKDLPDGSVVGTSSTRRRALMLRYYPGLQTKDIRGNVDTRLRKLQAGEYDAILLAEAGLIRLGIVLPAERLDPYQFVPAANQGVIAIVAREGSPEHRTLQRLNDQNTWLETRVERVISVGPGRRLRRAHGRLRLPGGRRDRCDLRGAVAGRAAAGPRPGDDTRGRLRGARAAHRRASRARGGQDAG